MNLHSDSPHDAEPTTVGPRKRSHAQPAVKPSDKEKSNKRGRSDSNKPPWVSELWDWSRNVYNCGHHGAAAPFFCLQPVDG